MQGKAAYIRPKVVGPCASGSYVHRAALFILLILLHLFLTSVQLVEVTRDILGVQYSSVLYLPIACEVSLCYGSIC
jgi:hypothetical protein